jgi:hypothetical protein
LITHVFNYACFGAFISQAGPRPTCAVEFPVFKEGIVQ